VNVLYVVIDALGSKDLCIIKKYCGNITKLIDQSTDYDNIYSNGCPTEFALPALFTGEYLLDNNGYKHGIRDKKITACELFKEKGFKTAIFSPVYYPACGGYDRGCDHFYNPLDLRVLLKDAKQTTNWYLDEYFQGRVSYEELDSEVRRVVAETISTLNAKNKNYEVSEDSILKLKQELDGDSVGLIDKFVQYGRLHITDVLDGIIQKKILSCKKRLSVNVIYIAIFLAELFYRKASLKTILIENVRKVFAKKNAQSKFPSAQHLSNRYMGWLKENKDTDTFGFLHILDFHEQNFYAFDDNTISLRWFLRILKRIWENRKSIKDIYQILSLFYVDDQLGRVVNFMATRGKNVVLITADHGNINSVKGTGLLHKVLDFHDAYYKVPLFITNREFQSSINKNFGSSVDILSTLFWEVFHEEDDRLSGVVLKLKGRDHIFFENQGRGPGDLVRKPIFIVFKDQEVKIKFRFKIIPQGKYFHLLSDVLDAHDANGTRLDRESISIKNIEKTVGRVCGIYNSIDIKISESKTYLNGELLFSSP
jgi:hypothetical protein